MNIKVFELILTISSQLLIHCWNMKSLLLEVFIGKQRKHTMSPYCKTDKVNRSSVPSLRLRSISFCWFNFLGNVCEGCFFSDVFSGAVKSSSGPFLVKYVLGRPRHPVVLSTETVFGCIAECPLLDARLLHVRGVTVTPCLWCSVGPIFTAFSA